MHIRSKAMTTLDGTPLVVDLEDFPHGPLSSVRKDDLYDIEFYSVPPGTRVMSYNETTRAPEFRDVKYWSVHRGKKVEIVNLQDGRQILTDNDPRAVYGIASDSDSLECGRFTPSDAMDRRVMVPTTNAPVSGIVDGMFYDFEDGLVKSGRTSTCVPLAFDFGQFVGLMAGDGWSDANYITCIADSEGFNAGFVVDFLKSGPYPSVYAKEDVFSADAQKDRYGSTVRYRINPGTLALGRRIKELVDGHGDDTTSGSANKRLPVWYQFAGKDFITGLINGLVATDGSVSVSHGKSRPQLQISFSSTSIRLAREFRRCCQLVGVKATLSFSKDTSGGNTAWMCTVSSVDAKKTGLLSRCCNIRKRELFDSSSVKTDDMYVKNDVLPFPKGVARRLVPLVPAAKTHGVDLDSLEPEEKARRLKYQAAAVHVRDSEKRGRITRGLVRRIAEIGNELADRHIESFELGMGVLRGIRDRFAEEFDLASDKGRRSWNVPASVCEADILSEMLSSMRTKACKELDAELRPVRVSLSMVRRDGRITWSQFEGISVVVERHGVPNTELRDSPDLAGLAMLAASDVTWTEISSVEKTGKEEVGYDLTVPGPDTFVSDDGVILSNTVNIHVPVSDKAVDQAINKMMPSKNLIKTMDLQSPMHTPTQEMTLGLYHLTKAPSDKPVQVYRTKDEAVQAYRHGEIMANDPIRILQA